MKARLAIGFLALGLMLGAALARADADLGSYLDTEIGALDGAVASCAAGPGGAEDGWWFKRFWLRVKPRATFTVPGVKVEITPEVELLWDRAYPDGWVAYKPAS